MARLARLTLPAYPHHIILRGNDRQAIFRTDDDRQAFLDLLATHARAQAVDVHAYVLMPNHVHLLVTPRQAKGVPLLMQSLGRSYVRRFNQTHGRTGTLWEGRYRCTLIQAERYLLACMAYIDLNAVRAGLVGQASDYVWSSHRHYVGLRQDTWLTPHALYWALDNTPFAREAAYADLVQKGLAMDQQSALTDAALSGWALGDAAFCDALQAQTARRLTKGRPGRPAKKS